MKIMCVLLTPGYVDVTHSESLRRRSGIHVAARKSKLQHGTIDALTKIRFKER